MSGRGSKERRQAARHAARELVYREKGAAYRPAINPFPDETLHATFERHYASERARYWKLESMREELELVYGT